MRLRRVCCLAPLWIFCSVLTLHTQIVTTTAGGFFGDGGAATSAGLDYPRFIVEDQAGNIYFTDSYNNRIRKINSAGKISTFAGTGIGGFSGDGGLARNAMLFAPIGLAFDPAGNMIVADDGNNRIRKIDTAGVISTIAGTGQAGFSGDGGPAIAAQMNAPWGLVLDTAGNIYFSDILNERIRKIDGAGIITTVAGNGTEGYNGDGIPATLAELDLPRDLAVDAVGNVFIADTMNHRVRVVSVLGVINTFAGNGIQGYTGDGGPATSAEIGNPRGVLVHGNSLLIANGGHATIRIVNFTTGIIQTFAGSDIGYDGDGNPPLLTEFDGPTGLLFTSTGSLLVGDQGNARIREVTPTVTTTKAGGFVGDNRIGTLAVLTAPENLAFDPSGDYYIADRGGNRIRKVDGGSGQITTIVNQLGISGYTGDGGPAVSAEINLPYGVAADGSGNIYIADTSNSVIRKVDALGTITTFATDPTISELVSLATDGAGNVYSADDGACVIRKITPSGAISVVAGDFTCGYNGDGIAATNAELNTAYGVAVDSKGNIYISDTLNNRIRKVNRQGIISTIAGNGTCGFNGDGGLATAAMICNPEGLAVDSRGNVYIADYLNLRVRKISPAGKIITVAGSGNSGYNGENLPAVSTNLDGPIAVGIDNVGTVFILDDIQARVRKIH
jgi:sugar lactone lactonase YvrE